MKLVILAAGFGTRLQPLTLSQPKALLPLGKSTLLGKLLERFAGCQKIDQAFIISNHRDYSVMNQWVSQLNGHRPFPIEVMDDEIDSLEQKRGAMADAQRVIHMGNIDDDTIIVAGDQLFGEGLEGFVEASLQCAGVMVGMYDMGETILASGYNTFDTDAQGRITYFEDKPLRHCSARVVPLLYHLPRKYLPMVKRYLGEGNNPDQPGRFIQWLYPRLPVYVHPIKGGWVDLRSLETYQLLKRLMS